MKTVETNNSKVADKVEMKHIRKVKPVASIKTRTTGISCIPRGEGGD